MKRIQNHKGVKNVFIINNQGQILRSGTENEDVEKKYASLISELARKARYTVRELDPENALTFLRVRTLTEEIMIAPEKTQGKYALVVVQDPTEGTAGKVEPNFV